jgi:hypothetical protein
VGSFQWGHAIKAVRGEFIRALLARRPITNSGL